jgi:hypothetical protein
MAAAAKVVAQSRPESSDCAKLVAWVIVYSSSPWLMASNCCGQKCFQARTSRDPAECVNGERLVDTGHEGFNELLRSWLGLGLA